LKRNIFCTADTHLNHANIIRYTNRPWQHPSDFDASGKWINKDIANRRAREMNEALIANWNALVGKNDIVYHLGDFAFGKCEEDFDKVFYRLNGSIIFIEGNHDTLANENRHKFAEYHEAGLYQTVIEGTHVVMGHYAMRTWNKAHYGAYNLYGHSHNSLPDDPNALAFDVGVDCHDYKPISWATVKHIMSKKTFKPIDHHGRDIHGESN
jgi:calcineurin-like phosphoesterase family protein